MIRDSGERIDDTFFKIPLTGDDITNLSPDKRLSDCFFLTAMGGRLYTTSDEPDHLIELESNKKIAPLAAALAKGDFTFTDLPSRRWRYKPISWVANVIASKRKHKELNAAIQHLNKVVNLNAVMIRK